LWAARPRLSRGPQPGGRPLPDNVRAWALRHALRARQGATSGQQPTTGGSNPRSVLATLDEVGARPRKKSPSSVRRLAAG
jgi:hypothetical protein